MEPFELLKATIDKINEYQRDNKGDEFNITKNEIKGNLPDVCGKLHDFINKNLCPGCFENKFPITFDYDQIGMKKWEAKGKRVNCKHGSLGYSICYNKNDDYIKDNNTYCKNCSYLDAKIEDALDYKNELEHFLIRLLFESAKEDKCSLSGRLEPGLYILAGEVIGGRCFCEAKHLSQLLKDDYAKSSIEVLASKKKIRNMLKE